MINPSRFYWNNPISSWTKVYKVREPKGFVLYCPFIEPGWVHRGALIREDVHINARNMLGSCAVVEWTLWNQGWQDEVTIR